MPDRLSSIPSRGIYPATMVPHTVPIVLSEQVNVYSFRVNQWSWSRSLAETPRPGTRSAACLMPDLKTDPEGGRHGEIAEAETKPSRAGVDAPRGGTFGGTYSPMAVETA